MIDLNDPTTTSLIALVISFILIVNLLWCLNPYWVQVINKNGSGTKSPTLIVSYSLTFSFVVAIAVLLYKSQNYQPGHSGSYSSQPFTFNGRSY